MKGLVNSMNLVLMLLFIAFVFRILKRTRAMNIFLCISVIAFLMVSTSFLPTALINNLERRFMPFDHQTFHSNSKVVIHVLGGGYVADESLPVTSQLSEASLSRVVEGARIFRMLPDAKVVFSGNKTNGEISMGEAAALAAKSLGMPDSVIKVLGEPSTTWEEVKAVKKHFPDHSIIVVTDAIHVPRAIEFYKMLGVEGVAAPAGFLVKEKELSIIEKMLPSSRNMSNMDRVIREYGGLWKVKYLNND